MVVQLLPRSFNEVNYPVWCVGFSCVTRFCGSFIGIFAVWIMVMSSETVIEIILNLTAVNFISELDELAFSLAEAGIFGEALKAEILQRILNLRLPQQYHAKPKHHWIVMVFVFLMLISL